MPALVGASTSCFVDAAKTWLAGTSPAMTESKLKLMRAFCGPRASRRRARSHAALRAGISAEDAAPQVLLGCSPLCARFSEFALTKAIVVALTMSGST
jgi:hypothetical protein